MMRRKLSATNKLVFLFVIVSLFMSLVWVLRFRRILGGAEEGIPFYNPLRTARLYSSIWWENAAPGFPVVVSLQWSIKMWIAVLLSYLLPNYVIQAILFSFLMASGLLGSYIFINSFLKNNFISLLGSIFYFFNLYSLTQVWQRSLMSVMFAWSYLPIFSLILIRWVDTGRLRYLVYLILSSFIFMEVFGDPGHTLILFVVPLVFIPFYVKDLGKAVLRFLLLSLFFLFFHGWWIIILFLIGRVQNLYSIPISTHLESLRGISAGIKFWDVPTLWHGLFLGKTGPWGWFYQNPLVLNFLRFIPLVLVVIGILKGRKEKYFPFLLTLLLVGWFVSKGTNPPLGYPFFEFLFFNFPFTAVLRNPWEKFGLVFVLPYSIFFALGVNFIYQKLKPKIREIAVGGILFLSCGVLVWPMWTGDVYTKDVHVQVPSFYEEANNFINSFGKGGRILMLPMIAGDGVKMTWGYGGIEPSEFLFDKPAISRILRTKYFDDVYWDLRDKLNKGKRLDSQDLRNLDVTFLVLRKDLVQGLDKNDLNVDELRNIILTNKDIRHLQNFGDLEIYLFEPNKNGSLFEILEGENLKISYQKFSPTRYKVFVQNSTKPFTLVFKNTYYDFWIARIGKEEIKDHLLVYNYANAWRIEKKGDYTIDIVFKVWPWE